MISIRLTYSLLRCYRSWCKAVTKWKSLYHSSLPTCNLDYSLLLAPCTRSQHELLLWGALQVAPWTKVVKTVHHSLKLHNLWTPGRIRWHNVYVLSTKNGLKLLLEWMHALDALLRDNVFQRLPSVSGLWIFVVSIFCCHGIWLHLYVVRPFLSPDCLPVLA